MEYNVDRRLDYDRARIFALVADVERYPSFVPAWRTARIVRREPDGYWTDQTIGHGPFQRRFRTHTRLTAPERIEVSADDRAFRRFDIHWRFDEPAAGQCRVDFTIAVEARSALLQRLIDAVLGELALGTVRAFEHRARRLYGEPAR